MVENICECCGIIYVSTQRGMRGKNQRYCSRKCYVENNIGIKHHRYGKHQTEQAKQKNSDAHVGKHCGEDHPRWKGGRKITKIRSENKRRRNLGFDLINKQMNDDEVAHHLTKEFVAFVPSYINKSCKHNIWTGKNMDEVNFYTLNYLFLVYNKE